MNTQRQSTALLDLEKVVGRRVRSLRESRGWSQAQLGRSLGDYGLAMEQPTVYKLEGGMRPIRVNEVAALALVFDVAVGDLLAERPGDKERADALHEVLVTTARCRDAEVRAHEAREVAAVAQDDARLAREARAAALERFNEVQHRLADVAEAEGRPDIAVAYLQEVDHHG